MTAWAKMLLTGANKTRSGCSAEGVRLEVKSSLVAVAIIQELAGDLSLRGNSGEIGWCLQVIEGNPFFAGETEAQGQLEQ